MDSEKFVPIKGYKGFYEINELGIIRSVIRNVYYRGKIHIHKSVVLKFDYSTEYPSVILSKKNNQKRKRVHRLVGLNFIPNPENKPEINHKDGSKLNCKKSNLEWSTRIENHMHAIETGLIPTGRSHCNNKSVIQYDLSGNFIDEFYSATYASIKTGIPLRAISMVATGRRKKTRQYVFKYSQL